MFRIKEEYKYPVLKLCNPNKSILSILTNRTITGCFSISRIETMNDVDKLIFKMPFKNRFISHKSCEMLVKFENDFYVIKNVKIDDEDKTTIDVECIHEAEELKGIKCQCVNLIGKSPKEIFDAIISSPKNVNLVGLYKWKGTDIVDTYRAVQTENECSVFQNLLTMCEKFNAWMEFSTDKSGQKWFYLRSKEIDNGKFIRKGEGLKSLNINVDSNNIFTRMYGYGSQDLITGNPINFISINNGKAYVENVGYFVAKGMTIEEISKVPRCLQETDFTDTNLTSKEELLRRTKEELAKVCVPRLDGSIKMSDFSVREDSCLTPPVIGEKVVYIDQDINYSISARTQSIQRDYDNPYNTDIGVSNVLAYNSILKDLVHNSDVTNSITNTDKDGNPYIPETSIKDGDHINLTYKLGNFGTRITETEKEIRLTAEEVDKNKAELVVQANKIESTVTRIGEAESHIEQNADAIKTKVSEKEMWSSIEQNASKITACIHGETDNMVQLDSNGLTVTNGGFRYENEDGDTLLESKAKGVRLGDSSWDKKTAMKNIVLGAVPLDNYFMLSNIYINDGLDMGKFNIEGKGTIEYNKIKADYLEVYNNAWVDGTLRCGSLECNDKHGVVDTENYGRILINAYETAEYYFGDIGESTITNDNKIEINIDSKFSETVNLSVGYHVFTSVYNGSISKIERLNNSFVIHGENGTNFSWELKAKAKGKENYRLEPSRVTAKGYL
ncbi:MULTISPECIES: phage tail protein [unclassified Clostridium]|uniref:phage tail protein n=1 Tax=unclassified Clostridium TaxID=2614128 RepID=UPI00207A5AD5|nr:MULTISPECIES: phage tail protein [unclassified Clostridium]